MKSKSIFGILFSAALLFSAARAQDLDDLMSGFGDETIGAMDDLLSDISKEKDSADFVGLKNACFSAIAFWENVTYKEKRGRRNFWHKQKGEEDNDWIAREEDGALLPNKKGTKLGPAWTMLKVPAAGKYRLWLRHEADRTDTREITLKFGDAEFKFNAFKLTLDASRTQEKELPIVFEDPSVRDSFPRGHSWVWEYQDVDLPAGETRVEINAGAGSLLFSHIFVSQSKRYEPNLGQVHASTLDKVYLRFRVRKAPNTQQNYRFWNSMFAIHYAYYPPNRPNHDCWALPMNGEKFDDPKTHMPLSTRGDANIKVGEWSDWLDVSWASSAVGGWCTGMLGFLGVDAGVCDVELAWRPHEGASLKTITLDINKVKLDGRYDQTKPAGSSWFIFPMAAYGRRGGVVANWWPSLERATVPAPQTNAVWGVYNENFINCFRSTEEFIGTYEKYAMDARRKLGIPEDAVWTNHAVSIVGSLGSNYIGMPAADKMALANVLKLVGHNRVLKLSRDDALSLGLEPCGCSGIGHETCDPADPARYEIIKQKAEEMLENYSFKRDDPNLVGGGDEIGVVCAPTKANESPACLARFRDFLRKKLDDPAAFFGVDTIDDLRLSTRTRTSKMGLFPRRHLYYTELFLEQLTADFYGAFAWGITNYLPKGEAYVNFSPAGLRQGSYNMNRHGWFHNTRLGGIPVAWGEDWIYDNYQQVGYEDVDFWNALVECTARNPDGTYNRAGFYNVAYCKHTDLSLYCSVARHLRILDIFSFGPTFASTGFEGPWSDDPRAYLEITRGTYGISLIDPFLTNGVQEARKTAVLYNRADEIWNDGRHGAQSERMMEFAALGACNNSADIILGEDITSEQLARYKAIFINGDNLPSAAVEPLKKWVEEGNLLVLSCAAAGNDEFNSPLHAVNELAGATFGTPEIAQQGPTHFSGRTLAANFSSTPLTTVTIDETEWSPAIADAMIYPKYVPLTPTSGRSIAKFKNGECAGVVNELGKGCVITWGFQVGLLYKGDKDGQSEFDNSRLGLFSKPVEKIAGVPSVQCSIPQFGITRYDKDDAIGILAVNFNQRKKLGDATFRVRADFPVSSITAAYARDIKFTQSGNEVTFTIPAPEKVDTFILNK